MPLADVALEYAITSGQLAITTPDHPAPATRDYQPASIDLRLSPTFRVFDQPTHGHIDPRQPHHTPTRAHTVPDGDPYVLHPRQLVLAATAERVRLDPSLAAEVTGKSSLARLGVQVHATAGWIDPGFDGQITLELINVNRWPLLLWPGDLIAQLVVFRLAPAAVRPYGHPDLRSRYQWQAGPTPARPNPI